MHIISTKLFKLFSPANIKPLLCSFKRADEYNKTFQQLPFWMAAQAKLIYFIFLCFPPFPQHRNPTVQKEPIRPIESAPTTILVTPHIYPTNPSNLPIPGH